MSIAKSQIHYTSNNYHLENKKGKMIKIISPSFSHINQIRHLNERYLIKDLDDEEMNDGFIRVKYSKNELNRIIQNKEIIVAVEKDKVIGYYLIGRKSNATDLQHQIIKAKSFLDIPLHKIGFGCQVCIDNDFRKKGLFNAMLSELKIIVKGKYSVLLCSVSENNISSLKVHIANEWQLIDTENTKYLLTYSTNK